MKIILASTVTAILASGTLAFAQKNLSGLTDKINDPNLRQAVARNITTGGVTVKGHYCDTCGKWIAGPPILANTNPEASPANLFKVKDGKNPGTLDK
jgi:hypothetical protein